VGKPLRGVRARLFAPVDGASLVFFRVAFGALMAWESYQYLLLGRVAGKYVLPATLLPWVGFEWLPRWPGDGLYIHFYGLLALALCIAAGFLYRAACALFCLGFAYLVLLSQAHFQNHFYLIVLLSALLCCVPAHRSLSVDARLRPALRGETVPAWSVWLLRGQLGVLYLFGGIAKLNGDWLHGWPMRLWLPERASLPLLGPLFEQAWVAVAMSWSGLLLDLLAFPALLWRRSRPFAFVALVVFHLWNSRLFSIGVFPWLAIATLTIFLEPCWPRRVFAWPRREPDPPASDRAWTPARRAGAALAAAWFAAQLMLPLRHHLYPGDPGWTGEGHAFAWRMKLVDKRGELAFALRDPATGRSWRVDPRQELDPFLYQRVAGDPQLIHLYARQLARRAGADGTRPIEVRAESRVSFNGRSPQPLVRPDVDLAGQPVRALRHQPWVAPLRHDRDAEARR